MNKATLLTLPSLIATLLTPVLSCGEDFLLYTPKPSEGEQAPASPDQGILVRSVTVKRGDTLAELSRKYIGRGSWFPQVLVFNKIKNPDLIITGDKLLIPVPAGQEAADEKKDAPERKHSGKHHHRGHRATHRRAAKTEAVEPGMAEPATSKPEQSKGESSRREISKGKAVKSEAARSKKSQLRAGTSEEQESYLQAKLVYLSGDYQKSLALFTEFLRKHPHSGSSADAALYRADCLLHLSGQ